MSNEQRTARSSTDDLRTLLVMIHATFAYGSSAVALSFGAAWIFVGAKGDLDVPVILPILTIASVVFTTVAWVSHEEIQDIAGDARAAARSSAPPTAPWAPE